MPHSVRPGDVLAGRYRLEDLLAESGGGRFWRARDSVLERYVAVHVISAEDERAAALLEAARRSATVHDQRILRVLDAEQADGICYVINEWGSGTSLDVVIGAVGAIGPRRSAWLVSEVADTVAAAHDAGVAHGRLVPENVLVDRNGAVKIIGMCVDAAMHGLAGDRVATDVTDLAGLLYCCLTGRWGGASASIVPPAPVHHGEVLRPRRVRAGIPGQLDALCDEVLHAQHSSRRAVGVSSAREIADFLAGYVGDPAGMTEALRETLPPLPDPPPVVLPTMSDPPVRAGETTSDLPPPGPAPDPEPDAAPDAEPAPPPDLEPETERIVAREPETELIAASEPTTVAVATSDADPPPVDQLPTQAGLPIFGDGVDDVSWLEKRTSPPPPPPPFEKHPERPLFAPEPSDGAPARRSRPGVDGERPAQDYWPFDSAPPPGSGSGGGNRPGTDAGTGTSGAGNDGVPGRSWLRLAAGLAAGLMLLVAVVVAYNLGRGKTVLGQEPDPQPDPTPSVTETTQPSAGPVTGLVADDFDPQGDGGEENPDIARLAVDGDPQTAWNTVTYFDQFGPGGLKTGIGLVVDLGRSREVTKVDLTLAGAPTGVALFLADAAPDDVTGLEQIASGTADGPRLSLEPEEPAPGRFLVVWLTSLPADGAGGFRGEIAEVQVEAVDGG